MRISRCVMRAAFMLPAVNFDNQLLLKANEIEDVAIKRHLPFELQAI